MRPANIVQRIGLGIAAASLLLIGLSAAPARAQELTPPAAADIVAVSPSQPEVAFAAAGTMIYRTDDGGMTWQDAGQLASPARSLTVTAGDAPALLAGTATAGLFRSFDGGATWQAVNDGLGMTPGTILEVNALGADPQDPRIVYAATGYRLGTSTVHFTPVALLVSVDSGASWLPLTSLPLNSPRFTDLQAVSGQPLTVAATSQDGNSLTYSVDGAVLATMLETADTSAARQAAAARALGMLGDTNAVPALLTAAQGNDPQVATAAVEALGVMRADSAVPTLAGLLMEPQAASLATVADALAAIGTPDAFVALHVALASDDLTPARHAAMGALEQLGSAAVPGLLEQAGSESAVVQRNAIEMLGWIADPAATDTLALALQASDPAVRSQAAWALGETLATITEPDAVQIAAQQALAAAAVGDLSPDVRLHATQSLARLPQQPVVGVDIATVGAVATANYAPVGQESGLQLPGWLAAAMPALRWLVLGLALAAIGALPWLQNVRDHRRRRRQN